MSHQRESHHAWMLVSALTLLLILTSVHGLYAQGAITDGPITFEFTTTGTSATGPLSNLTNGTTDHLHQVWWWQQGAGGAAANQVQLSYPAPNQSFVGNVATLTWPGATWTYELVITLTTDPAGAGAQLVHQLTITNNSGAAAATKLYCYADFDVNGAGNDSADLVSGNPDHMHIADGTLYSDFLGVGADAYQVTLYPTLRDSLLSTTPIDLNNTGLPFLMADFTGGFQWNRTVASGASETFVAVLTYNQIAALVPPVNQLLCTNLGTSTELSWVNSSMYDSIEVLRDGTSIAMLPGTATTFAESIGAGTYDYQVIATVAADASPPSSCQLNVGLTHTLVVDDLDAFAGQNILEVPISGTSITSALGYTFAVQFPTDRLTATTVDYTGSAPALGNADFMDFQLGMDFVTGAVTMDTVLPFTPPLPPASNMLLGTLVFSVSATVVNGETRTLDFVDGLGGVDNEYVLLTGPVPAFTSSATVTFFDSPMFIRGDCTADGGLALPDAIFLLNYLFSFGVPPTCFSACDADDNGAVQLPDAIVILNYLFSQGTAPPAPFPTAGQDPTPDALTCL